MILRRQMPLSAQEHRPIWQADLAAGQSFKEASYHYLEPAIAAILYANIDTNLQLMQAGQHADKILTSETQM